MSRMTSLLLLLACLFACQPACFECLRIVVFFITAAAAAAMLCVYHKSSKKRNPHISRHIHTFIHIHSQASWTETKGNVPLLKYLLSNFTQNGGQYNFYTSIYTHTLYKYTQCDLLHIHTTFSPSPFFSEG